MGWTRFAAVLAAFLVTHLVPVRQAIRSRLGKHPGDVVELAANSLPGQGGNDDTGQAFP